MMKYIKLLCVLLLVISLAGCHWWGKKDERLTPETLYSKGQSAYQDGDYADAITFFQRLKEEYPLSKYAITAELKIADSYFNKEDYISAELSYQDFLDFHPTNENLPYVMFQIGMCHFNQMRSIDRDQTETHRAKEAFEKLIARFPSSQYTFMAEKNLRDCRKKLAEHEFYVGNFYFKTGHYEAALKRFKEIENEYPNLGLDYKVSYYINETHKRIERQKGKKE
ncbi:MAG: outer membrane protein assembly factor BamD [Deltaproteobacteria bacterium]|nr:outer membrane protein assembly factor BamD [Deltaproteobacteria bacterium]